MLTFFLEGDNYMETKRPAANAPGHYFADRSDFDRIREGLRRRYQPQNVVEEFLVKSAANSQWKLQIAEILEGETYTMACPRSTAPTSWARWRRSETACNSATSPPIENWSALGNAVRSRPHHPRNRTTHLPAVPTKFGPAAVSLPSRSSCRGRRSCCRR